MKKCVFCPSILESSADSFELPGITSYTYITDLFPVTPGHTLIVPNRHVAQFEELTEEELNELPKAILALYEYMKNQDFLSLYEELLSTFGEKLPKTKPYIEEAMSKLKDYNRPPDGFNHGLNDCFEAGRTVDHLHYHIMPRWIGDSDDPRGGVRHMFLGKGNYHK